LKLQGYVDVDLVGNVDSKKSTTRFVYNLGGTTLCWVSKLQKIVVLSTTKAEYVAMTKARKEKV
jgi:hypothetical protein